METKYKYVGYNTHRLKENDDYHKLEVAFVEEINQELKYNPNFLDGIVQKNRYVNELLQVEYDYLTEEEEKVALSVIQWLGTPVGQGFLERVKAKYEQ